MVCLLCNFRLKILICLSYFQFVYETQDFNRKLCHFFYFCFFSLQNLALLIAKILTWLLHFSVFCELRHPEATLFTKEYK